MYWATATVQPKKRSETTNGRNFARRTTIKAH